MYDGPGLIYTTESLPVYLAQCAETMSLTAADVVNSRMMCSPSIPKEEEKVEDMLVSVLFIGFKLADYPITDDFVVLP